MLINKIVENYLEINLTTSKPILLAFSGGVDSSVLLNLLLTYKLKKHLDLHLAHVDHGWRAESALEAAILKKIASTHSLPFHLKKLDPKKLKGNLENSCREERLKFFQQLTHQFDFQAVITGHHADDHAETVLKRFFEGACLTRLSGFKSCDLFNGLVLWRPLLTVTKKEIISWAQKEGISYLDDSTNRELKFLRSRMRLEILPFLSQSFRKEIQPSLNKIGQESLELREYLDRKTSCFMELLIRTPYGVFLDLHDPIKKGDICAFEVKHLLRRIARLMSVSISFKVLDELSAALMSQKCNRSIEAAHLLWSVDRARLYIEEAVAEKKPLNHLCIRGECNEIFDEWMVEVNFSKNEKTELKNSWRHSLSGNMFAKLSFGEFQLGLPKLSSMCINGRTLSKWFADNKVPVFLRKKFPVLWQNGQIVHEFLTGKQLGPYYEEGWAISLKHISALSKWPSWNKDLLETRSNASDWLNEKR